MPPAYRDRDRVTAILVEQDDDADGADDRLERLFPLVYDELRAMAVRRLRDEDAITLSATELVHEAYLRLADATRVTARGRAYFFASAARAMRRIVVDHARKRGRQKRGGGQRAITLEGAEALVQGADVDVLELDHALDELAAIAERAARVVECRFYAGLGVADVARALNVTPRTVNRDWEFARTWLFDFLRGDGAVR